ncbi:MAG: hypothetical protein KF699_08820 [Phycisphaeraceae bacterium]|nr:hypothetical protein [Phycisphaeraceae bacterium]
MIAYIAPSSDGSAVPMWASLLMVVMGLALTVMVAYQIARSQAFRRGVPMPRDPAPPPAQPGEASRQPSAAPPGPAVARELEELCVRVADELDRRAERLEKLIADADSKLARLERLTAGAVTPDPLAVLAETKPRAAAAPMHDGDPIAGEVYRLADSGLPPVQIAQKLGQHTGKVELILALRRA